MSNISNYDLIQKAMGYQFSDISLLENALTHSSYANENGLSYVKNNERLEFLGDAVLELVSSRYIFEKYADMREGKMTKLRAALVCEPSLAGAARELDLTRHIRLSHGEKNTGGGERDSILSDAFEALIGAIYLDGGFESASTFVHRFVLKNVQEKQMLFDSKSDLQELVQEKYHANSRIEYKLIDESGPAHKKCFVVSCYVQGKELGRGEGQTKKKAESKAAYEAMKRFIKKR